MEIADPQLLAVAMSLQPLPWICLEKREKGDMKPIDADENPEKIDMTLLVSAMYMYMSASKTNPKQMYMQCQQGICFPPEVQKIIKQDICSRDNGTLFENILEIDETDFVFWNVALRKFLIKLTGMVGVANVALLLQNQLNTIKNTGTTLSEIKKINDKIFSIWQKIPAGNTTPILRQTYTMQALDGGSPQAVHFAAALRQNIQSAKMMESHMKVDSVSNESQSNGLLSD